MHHPASGTEIYRDKASAEPDKFELVQIKMPYDTELSIVTAHNNNIAKKLDKFVIFLKT